VGVGVGPRRTRHREAGKHFFFEKKKQKTLIISASVLQERLKPNSQSFWFFLRFLLLALARRWTIRPTWAVNKKEDLPALLASRPSHAVHEAVPCCWIAADTLEKSEQ
jgi:hypothetical protein